MFVYVRSKQGKTIYKKYTKFNKNRDILLNI